MFFLTKTEVVHTWWALPAMITRRRISSIQILILQLYIFYNICVPLYDLTDCAPSSIIIRTVIIKQVSHHTPQQLVALRRKIRISKVSYAKFGKIRKSPNIGSYSAPCASLSCPAHQTNAHAEHITRCSCLVSHAGLRVLPPRGD